MSRLMGQLFNESPLLVWPMVSLAIFMVTFMAVLVATLRRRSAEVEGLAALPLEDEGREP
ncbi:MAG: hypothetical protein JNK04_12185 [Myxococcales bacterium]|nr:hypothetical protein [Myxococcales bacterium]